MKKTYITPAIRLVEARLQRMIATSVTNSTTSGQNQLSRQGGDWDDED